MTDTAVAERDVIDVKPMGPNAGAIQPYEPRSTGAVTPMDMIDRALASGAAAETLERLLALQERWEANQARKAFDEAMAGAKAEIPVINKNREVDFTSQKGRTHYRHEDLAEIARTVNPILSRHGLSYRFRTTSNLNEPISVTCIVTHRMGHFEENTLWAGRDDTGNKNSHQSVASAVTYLQRYTLKAALGLAAGEDDDGRGAGGFDNDVITDEQVGWLKTLIDETGADTAKFCAYLKVASLEEIPARDYGRAKSALEAKRSKAPKAETNDGAR